MSKYRIKQIGDEYFPQVKFLFCFWENIKLKTSELRYWYYKLMNEIRYKDTARVDIYKDSWGVTTRHEPKFTTLDSAKDFIFDYKNYLAQKYIESHPKIKTKIYKIKD